MTAAPEYVTVNGTVYRYTRWHLRSGREVCDWRRASVPYVPPGRGCPPVRYRENRLPAGHVVVTADEAQRLIEASHEAWRKRIKAAADQGRCGGVPSTPRERDSMTDYATLEPMIEATAAALGDQKTPDLVRAADELIDRAIPFADDVLDHLVLAQVGAMIASDCLLDECDERTYATERAMADLLVAAIRRQDTTRVALRELIADDIAFAMRMARASEGASA